MFSPNKCHCGLAFFLRLSRNEKTDRRGDPQSMNLWVRLAMTLYENANQAGIDYDHYQ
jgi:hypothetical protein